MRGGVQGTSLPQSLRPYSFLISLEDDFEKISVQMMVDRWNQYENVNPQIDKIANQMKFMVFIYAEMSKYQYDINVRYLSYWIVK